MMKNHQENILFTDSEWEDKNSYWLSNIPQCTNRWADLRIGSIPSSMISSCTGRSNYISTDEIVNILCGTSKNSFNSEKINNRLVGNYGEEFLRNWFEEELNKYNKQKGLSEIKIKKPGIGIWKQNPIFRGSMDGDIDENSCVEFKIPKKMYTSLIKHMDKIKNGKVFDKFYHEHIKNNHYDQMQQNMVVHNKKTCRYVVYSIEEELLYHEIIPLNLTHWNEILYPRGLNFYNKYLKPEMDKLGIKRIDPNENEP